MYVIYESAKASLKGMVGGGGIDDANTAAGHVNVMKKAYELGKELRASRSL